MNEHKWDSKAENYDNWCLSSHLQSLQKAVVSSLNLRNNQKLLDIGCGTGMALRLASDLVNNQGEFYGIDISSQMISKSKENSASYENMHFYKASSDALPFKDNFFDLIMCSSSFHHYPNPSKAVEEMARVLKPGGRVYIQDSTADSLIIKMIRPLLRFIEKGFVKIYSSMEYKNFFEIAGLKYIKTIPIKYDDKIHVGEK